MCWISVTHNVDQTPILHQAVPSRQRPRPLRHPVHLKPVSNFMICKVLDQPLYATSHPMVHTRRSALRPPKKRTSLVTSQTAYPFSWDPIRWPCPGQTSGMDVGTCTMSICTSVPTLLGLWVGHHQP